MKTVIPIFPAKTGGGSQPQAAFSETLEFRVSPPLALYIHVPWCVRKCPYCDFNSHAVPQALPEVAYVDALIADLQSALPLVWGRPIVSIFFGGGTPSLLSPESVDRLLASVRALLPWSADIEITLEANPGTVEAGRFHGFRQAGINRLSLGIQSFDDARLAAIGRIHNGLEARTAIDLAGRYFERLNLDLMYALPGQDLAGALADVDTALGFGTGHLSCYQLTMEPNTAFGHTPPPDLPDGDVGADMQEAIEMRLAGAGYANYETSAFARPGQMARHNLNYWYFGDYLGIGAGAHSKLTLHDRVLRQSRLRGPDTYLKAMTSLGAALQEDRCLAARDLPFEFLMNALRLAEGFPPALFEARTGQSLACILPRLQQAEADGLLQIGPERIAPTLLGRRFLNRLLARFLDENQD